MTLTDYMYREKKEEVDLPALKSVDALIQLEGYIEKRGGKLITATRNNTDDKRISRTEITRKQKWEEKPVYGRFKRLTSEISHDKKKEKLNLS